MTDTSSAGPPETPEEGGPDDTLSPSEATDSDEVANADGDEVVDPPEHWHAADRPGPPESLERRLDAEEPDPSAEEPVQRDTDETRPEDGQGDDSLFPVVR